MRAILQKRALRFVFGANMISMLGSGMNSAAVAWYILQATHSEMALGMFAVLQTIPAMLMLPFTGVLIDREDRRRLVMMLDSIRAVIIATVAVLAFAHRVKVWELYLMNTLVSAGFWMFWPTITALIQELTPGEEFVHANTFLLAGVQGGWLLAGSVVGFAYNHIGLGGVLVVDVLNLCCLVPVLLRSAQWTSCGSPARRVARRHRRGRNCSGALCARDARRFPVSSRPPQPDLAGTSWALFLGAMLTGVVVTAPLSDQVFHAGAVGYGWLNAGWGIGAFISALYTPWMIAQIGSRRAIAIAMGILAICMILAPLSPWLAIAVLAYGAMGSARGISSVAMNTSIMEQVPQHFMGRVQNTFYFAGTALQMVVGLLVGAVAQFNLVAGFSIIGLVYVAAFVSANWPVGAATPVQEGAET